MPIAIVAIGLFWATATLSSTHWFLVSSLSLAAIPTLFLIKCGWLYWVTKKWL
jgi:hypothetical protein